MGFSVRVQYYFDYNKVFPPPEQKSSVRTIHECDIDERFPYWNFEKVVDDWILLCMIIGNDFLPVILIIHMQYYYSLFFLLE